MNNKFKIGDVVSRKKYGNDILFKIDKIVGNKVFLKGLEIRLYADANIEDIALSGIPKKKEEITSLRNLNTNDYFYIPGKILHIDSDNEYLYKVAIFQEHSYLYDSDDIPDFHFSRLNSNGLWSCKNGIGGGIEKGNKPVAGFAYKLIKVLDINK